MHPGFPTAGELYGREIGTERAEHYRGHLENAQVYLDLVENRGGDPSWSATAREWIQHCGKILGEPKSGTVN